MTLRKIRLCKCGNRIYNNKKEIYLGCAITLYYVEPTNCLKRDADIPARLSGRLRTEDKSSDEATHLDSSGSQVCRRGIPGF